MDTSDPLLSGLQSPDWRAHLRALQALIEINDPQYIPALVESLVKRVDLADGMTDMEAITETAEEVVYNLNEAARAPLEKVRDQAAEGSLTLDVAAWLLSQLDWWQELSKDNPGIG